VSEIKEILAKFKGYPTESDFNEGDPKIPVPAGVRSLYKIARLCNGAKFKAEDVSLPIEERAIKGDATDTAILRFAESLSSPAAGFDSATLVASREQL
jgi:sodium/potassium-transporting ATPase subunit alpha